MNPDNVELQRQIHEHGMAAMRLFDEAKRLQRESYKIPIAERGKATDAVISLEKEAIAESRKNIALEKQLVANQRDDRQQQVRKLYKKEIF